MKKFLILSVTFGLGAFNLAMPVQAGLLSGALLRQAAQVVLNNRAVLNKGTTQCPSQISLAPHDNLLIAATTAAVQRSLPVAQFNGLQGEATQSANAASASPTFCQTTAVKKPGLLGGIADVARKMGVGGGLLGGGSAVPSTGGLGGILGGGTPAPTSGQ